MRGFRSSRLAFFLFALELIPLLASNSLIYSKKTEYSDSAINFLRQYGDYYNLFGYFFNTTNADPRLSKPPESLNEPISARYHVRDFSNYEMWFFAPADSTPWERLDIYDEKFRLNVNNRYRYGPDPYDRFLSISASGDPWNHEIPYIGRIDFIGFENAFDLRYYGIRCDFKHPVVTSEAGVVECGILG